MSGIPSYCKIITLGSAFTDNALIGEVIIQEKVDGSQFRFGKNEQSKLVIGTKGTIITHPDENKMFKFGSEYIFSIEEKILKYPENSFFYGEYLEKPKHNVLSYEKVPKNHIVLFDAIIGSRYITDRNELTDIANNLDIDIIPELFRGKLKDRAVGGGFSNPLDHLKRIIETTPSFLGNEVIEGCVIKNYNQTIMLGGNVFPLFTKFVRQSYKERHVNEWSIKNPKDSLEEYIKGFKNENRWIKAILHLKEKGLITQSPKDIGILLKEVQNDILTEETENIKNSYLINLKTI
jgi:hypothetical protein